MISAGKITHLLDVPKTRPKQKAPAAGKRSTGGKVQTPSAQKFEVVDGIRVPKLRISLDRQASRFRQCAKAAAKESRYADAVAPGGSYVAYKAAYEACMHTSKKPVVKSSVGSFLKSIFVALGRQ